MAPPYAHTGKVPIGPLNTYLTWICDNWQLQSATKCIPRMISPEGEGHHWQQDLVCELMEVARTTPDKRKAVIRDLVHVWRLRLRRYPESAPYLLAQDVAPVLKRHVFLLRCSTLEWAPGELEAITPKLDTIPTPPKWRMGRRRDVARAAPMEPRAVVAPNKSNGVDIERPLPPVPANCAPALRLRALRRREIVLRKERDLARTRYEIALLDIENDRNNQ